MGGRHRTAVVDWAAGPCVADGRVEVRERKDIEEEVTESNAENNGQDTIALLQLEVLLDIRDILNKRLPAD